MIKYPAQIDDSQSIPPATNNITPVTGSVFNNLRQAVLALENELGTKPSGLYSSVKGRMQYLENVVGNLQIIELNNDLGGSLSLPKVIGLQGKPVSNSQPTAGDLLFWNGTSWLPQKIDSVLPIATEPGQVLLWNGQEFIAKLLNQDDILPPLSFNIISGTKEILSLGESWAQGFNLFKDGYLNTALLTDNADNIPKNVLPEIISSGGTFCESDISYSKTQFNSSVIYTITITSGVSTKQVTNTLTWGQPVYAGLGLLDGYAGTVEQFIKSLDYKVVTTQKNHTFNINTSFNQKAYFACRSAYGNMGFIVNNFQGGFSKVATVNDFDNDYGFTESYDLYESDNAGLGVIILNTIGL
jgi:hypothetical protein